MSDKLQQAIAAIKSGDKATGKQLLSEILKENPRDEKAWLWMTQVVVTKDDKVKCLRNVLKINPNNESAKRGLAKLQGDAKSSTSSKSLMDSFNSLASPVKIAVVAIVAISVTLMLCLGCFSFGVIRNVINSGTNQQVASQQVEATEAPVQENPPEPTDTPVSTKTSQPPTFTPESKPKKTPIPIIENTPTPHIFNYEVVTETSGATSYIIKDDIAPKLNLDKNGGIGDVESVNAVLILLNLPTVSTPVPQLSSITGLRPHRGQYQWEDYPLGTLIIWRSLCRDENYENYDCIWKVTIGGE